MRHRRRLRLLGAVLLLYGLAGIVLFVAVALGLTRPLDRAQRLSESIDDQRAALINSLAQAETTIRQMSSGVGRMDTSLSDARAATDRASAISRGVATSMYQLRDTMSVEIPLLGRPLEGLAPAFNQSGQNLELLGQDVANIGIALEANRADVMLTSRNLVLLADAVGELTTAVDEGPDVTISKGTMQSVRLAILAVSAWMVLLALGCVVAGLYLLSLSRRRPVVVSTA